MKVMTIMIKDNWWWWKWRWWLKWREKQRKMLTKGYAIDEGGGFNENIY